jgi:hypothetical protein
MSFSEQPARCVCKVNEPKDKRKRVVFDYCYECFTRLRHSSTNHHGADSGLEIVLTSLDTFTKVLSKERLA